MRKTIAAMDFGTSKLVAIQAETTGRQQCDISAVGTAAYDGYMGGQWNAPDSLNAAIRDTLENMNGQNADHRKPVREITVGVPAGFVRLRTVEGKVELQGSSPKVTQRDVETLLLKATNEIEQEKNGQVIQRSVAWFTVDDGNKVMDPVGMHGQELRGLVSFIIADQYFTDDVTQRFQALNVEVRGFLSTSLGQAMLYIPSEVRDQVAVLIDTGYLNTEVMVVEGDALTSLTTIPMGGGHLAMELAYGLHIPMDSAEDIKRKYVYTLAAGQNSFEVKNINGEMISISREEVDKVLEPAADKLCKAIADAIDESSARLTANSKVYMTGGGLAYNHGGRELLSAKIGRPVRELPRKTAKMTTPPYSSVWGLLDTMCDNYDKASAAGGISGFFRSLFGA